MVLVGSSAPRTFFRMLFFNTFSCSDYFLAALQCFAMQLLIIFRLIRYDAVITDAGFDSEVVLGCLSYCSFYVLQSRRIYGFVASLLRKFLTSRSFFRIALVRHRKVHSGSRFGIRVSFCVRGTSPPYKQLPQYRSPLFCASLHRRVRTGTSVNPVQLAKVPYVQVHVEHKNLLIIWGPHKIREK